MHQYKESNFYNEYFRNRKDCKLISEFHKIICTDQTSYYVGTVEILNTIHPLSIRVELPANFPHGNAKLWTTSIFGYPHLINTLSPHFDQNDKSNHSHEKWSWFCLNTPFAETAEEQLNQEMSRLHEWIDKNIRPDLSAIITDIEFIRALQKANAYNWENVDEISEYSSEAKLTFIGDWANDAKKFAQNVGVLHCVKRPSNKYYVVENGNIGNVELPYVIVDGEPSEQTVLKDFVALSDEYNLPRETCSVLLPYDFVKSRYSLSDEMKSSLKNIEDEKEAIRILDNAIGKLVIQAGHQTLIDKVVSELKADISKSHGYKPLGDWGNRTFRELEDMSQEESEEYEMQSYYEGIAIAKPYFWKSFALGIRKDSRITWLMMTTREYNAEFHNAEYDLGLRTVTIRELLKLTLIPENAQTIQYDQYFGRGGFNEVLCNAHIGIIGLGAIGSQVAEILVRSGVKQISLWDGDLVEPGNICRSIYNLSDLGDSKHDALIRHLDSISPFCQIPDKVRHIPSDWYFYKSEQYYTLDFNAGYFYGNINYKSQKTVLTELGDCDIVIDCTASNELLHFLSYAIDEKVLISLAITNHANDLVCVTNSTGNPFELRKHYLAKIEQDTKNYYHEGSGCYSPTFLASYSDISTLIGLATREINRALTNISKIPSVIWSYGQTGIIADKLETYTCQINNESIVRLTIGTESIFDAQDINSDANGWLGFLLGGVSADGSEVYITNIVDFDNAEERFRKIFVESGGIIDYLGDLIYSIQPGSSRYAELETLMADKAADVSININNPIVAMRDTDGVLAFYLYINCRLLPFIKD